MGTSERKVFLSKIKIIMSTRTLVHEDLDGNSASAGLARSDLSLSCTVSFVVEALARSQKPNPDTEDYDCNVNTAT